jgi:hypothetical protein
LIAVTATILFSLSMDLIGSMYIAERGRGLVRTMAAFEHAPPGEAAASPIPPGVFIHSAADTEAFKIRARTTLQESIRLGIYRPPAL